MTGKLNVTRRGALRFVFGAPALFCAAGAALAGSGTGKNSADVGHGDSIMIPTSRTRYTWVQFTNLGRTEEQFSACRVRAGLVCWEARCGLDDLRDSRLDGAGRVGIGPSNTECGAGKVPG